MQTSRTFRIFVSSTFSDLKVERNALQERVFPRLRDLCARHGARFQAIDLRWGVSEEATLDQQTMMICLGEIERCQRVTPRPNFLVLLGDRYGWRPLPLEIPVEEYREILHNIPSPEDGALLDRWYRRDDNAVPSIYCLQPRTGEMEDFDAWGSVEHQLRSILLQATAKMDLPAEARLKYTASATEQEIALGALNLPDAREHVFCFLRRIDGLPEDESARDFSDLAPGGRPDAIARAQLDSLKDRLRRQLPGHVFEYEAAWSSDGAAGEHIDRLCQDAYRSLSRVILEEETLLQEVDPLDKEISEHAAFGEERARAFVGRREPLRAIGAYLARDDRHPLAVHGASGSGKSALLAEAARLARREHPDVRVIIRFIGTTPESSDPRSLLEGLCRQISRCYEADERAIPTDHRELVRELPNRLALAVANRPLVLFLDALDQLSAANNAHDLHWLPAQLPEHVRLVVSTTSGETSSYLQRRLPAENLLPLEPMGLGDGAAMLSLWLAEAKRTLLPSQRAEILARFRECGLPLYLRLAFGEARRWRSYDNPVDGAHGGLGLGHHVPGVLRDALGRLSRESNHGATLVSRGLGYLAAARNGLTEDEMLDLLSLDPEVLADFHRRSPRSPAVDRLPVVLWSRLRFDLEPYLAERSADGTSLMAFFHRQVGEVVAEEYLSGQAVLDRHRALARYFGGQSHWIEGDGTRVPNRRKVSELPYQQTRGEMWPELEATLTDLEFVEVKATAGMVHDLVADYGVALASDGLSLERQPVVAEFARFVRARSHGLMRRPDLAIQEAYNAARSGQVASRAGSLLTRSHHPWLRRINRPEARFDPCVQILRGHDLAVRGVAVLPGGRYVLTGSAMLNYLKLGSETDLRIWDLATGACLQTLQGEPGGVNSLAVSPDGALAVVACDDRRARVWDLRAEVCMRRMEGHSEDLFAVAMVSDGRRAVTVGWDGGLKLWELSSGRCLRTMQGPHGRRLTGVVVTPDGRFAVTAGIDCVSRVWDLDSGECVRVLWGADAWAVAVTPDGRRVVTGSLDGKTRVWDLECRGRLAIPEEPTDGIEAMAVLTGHTSGIEAVAVTPDGGRAVTGGRDRTVRVWDLSTGACLRVFDGHTGTVTAIAISPDGLQAVTGSEDRTARIWDLAIADLPASCTGHNAEVTAVAVSPDGHLAVTGSKDKAVRVWDLETGDCLHTMEKQWPGFDGSPGSEGHTEEITSVAVTPDGRRAVTGSQDSQAVLWDLVTGKSLQVFRNPAPGASQGDPVSTPIGAVVVTPDGRSLVTVSRFESTAAVWDLSRGKHVRRLDRHEGHLEAFDLAPGGRFAVASGKDGNVTVWDLSTGGRVDMSQVRLAVSSVTCTPEGLHAVGAHGTDLSLWDLGTGQHLASFSVEPGVSVVAVAPDGHRVVGGSLYGVAAWDIETGDRLWWTREGHGHQMVTAVLVGPEGRYAATVGCDGAIRVWELATGVEVACYLGDSAFQTGALSPSGTRIVAGDAGGQVHILSLENVVPGPPVLTAWHLPDGGTGNRPGLWHSFLNPISSRATAPRSLAFGCTLCRTWSLVDASALGTGLLCPRCGEAVRLNPFAIEADWRPVAKAWECRD